MTKFKLLCPMVIVVFFGFVGIALAEDCASVDSQLNISMPCVDVGGVYYEVGLERIAIPDDPNGYYWTFTDDASPADYNEQCGTTDSSNLDISLPCVNVYGLQLQVELKRYISSSGPLGLYWELGIYQEVGSAQTFNCVTDENTPCSDQLAFFEIKRSGDTIKNIWDGKFDFANWPIYIVHNNSGSATAGYMINPPEVGSSSKLADNIAQGLNVYRYDEKKDHALQTLADGNELFDFFYDINGVKFSMMVYTDEDYSRMQSDDFEWINTLVHETFHAYQDKWAQVEGSLQDDGNYPLNVDILSLAILESKVLAAGYKVTTDADREKYLKMYLATRTKKMEIDTSSDNLVTNMDNSQEHGEGTADYIEARARKNFDSNYLPKHYKASFEDELGQIMSGAATKEDAQGMFTWNYWYKTGSIILFLLEDLKKSFVSDIEAGKTPYDIIKGYYPLSATEREDYLNQAKTEFNWTEITTVASKLASS